MQELLEREDKWDVNDRFELPHLHDLIDGGEIDRTTVHLESAYYDTADHDLLSHGIVLRRRDGDDDTGWQLKVPDAEDASRFVPPSRMRRPPSWRELLTGFGWANSWSTWPPFARRAPDPRARRSDRACAEIADDQVHASVEHELLAWREIEVEYGPDARSLSRRLAKRLSKAGARPSRYPSKLAHALPAPPPPEFDGAGPLALATYVASQIEAIFDGDMGLRRGQDPIHDTRVAIRRLRSAIRVFGKLVDRSAAGTSTRSSSGSPAFSARSATVRCSAGAASPRDWPPELVLGPVNNRINTDLHPSNCGPGDSGRCNGLTEVSRHPCDAAAMAHQVAPHQRAHRQQAAQAGEPGRTQG
jgi:hypothetical protein